MTSARLDGTPQATAPDRSGGAGGSEHGSGPQRAPGKPAAPPVSPVDWAMLVLAIVSVALLSWITFWEVDPTWERRVVIADYVICGIFAVEYLIRWRRSGMGWKFLTSYWYEIIGMIPLSNPAFRGFRLLRIVVVIARLARAADRAFGDRATAYVVGRFADTIVSVIRRPVTVAVLDEVIAVVQAGHYAQHISSAIEENRAELDALILDLIKEDQRTGMVRYVPFHDELVRQVSDTVFRISHRALDDPRVHELISDVIRESATQLRQSVRENVVDEVRSNTEKVGH